MHEWKPIAEAPQGERVLGGWYQGAGQYWHWGACRYNEFSGRWAGERGGEPSHYLPLPDAPPRGAGAVPEAPQLVPPDATVNWDGAVITPPVAPDASQ